MRIGLYHGAAGTRAAGGIAVYTRQLARALAGDHDVVLYTRPGPLAASVADAGVTVVEIDGVSDRLSTLLPRITPLGPQGGRKVATALAARDQGVFAHADAHLDVLVTFQFLDDLLCSHAVDVPTAFGYHRFDTVGTGTWLRERLSRTDVVLANSRHTADRIAATFGYAVDGVVPPGVDTTVFRPDVTPAIDREEPVVAFAGRFVPGKGIDVLLEAVARLEGPVHLLLVGTGDTAAVERHCRARGIEERVTMVGEVPHRTLPAHLVAADVFCLPSHSESFGLVNLEAMACGTPVVTTALPAVTEYLTDGSTGLLVAPGDPDALARALGDLLADPHRRRRMGRRARRVARGWTWDRQAKRLVTVFADALPRKAGVGFARPDLAPREQG